MPNAQRRIVKARVQLVAVNGTADLWLDLMQFLSSVGVTRIRGRIVLCEKSGNFRCRVGIQTALSDQEVPDAPVSPSTGAGLAYISTVSKNFIDFDPTGANEGNIKGKESFRVGLFYSSTDATVSRGDVLVELHVDA